MLRPLEVLLERCVSEEAEKLGGCKRAGAKADKPTTAVHRDQTCRRKPNVQVAPPRPLAPRGEAYMGGEDILGGGVSRLETSVFALSVCAADVLDAMDARVDSAGS